LVALAACGGDDGGDDEPEVPATVTVGPVTLTTDPLAVSIAGYLDLVGYVQVGTVTLVDPAHYYDPRDLAEYTWQRPERAVAVDGDWLVLDTGARIRLVAETDPAVVDSAVLEVDSGAVERAVVVQLALASPPGEPIFGFGSTPAGVNAAGQVREAQFRVDFDSESGLNEQHVPVPLALWPRLGAGMFVEDRRSGAFDLGATDPGLVTATFNLPARGPYRMHLFTADPAEPLDLVRRYVALTAKPAVPPRWAFAPMQWRNEHASSDEVLEDAQQMRALGIPDTTIWIDNPWQTGYNTFVFDEERFEDPAGLIAELTALGYKVLLWSTPYVNTTGATAADYSAGLAQDFFVTDDGGGTIVFPWAEGPSGLVDFTRPGATEWWRERIQRVTDLGIDGFKLDYGEDIVPDLAGTLAPFGLAAGDAQDLHGAYQRYYHDAYYGALPPGDGFLLTRAGAWGDQDRNTAIWPGDLDNDFSRHGPDEGGEDGKLNVGGLPAAVACGLSLSVSGYPFFGSDIGGFRNGTPETEALIRWTQYAALGTIMQLGGAGPSHNPWDTSLYDPPALDVYREYARLHMDLNPYLWTLALAAGVDGTPVTRPAAFMDDCACDDAMFLVGDAILVAPVIEAGATTREVVLPSGRWFDWWTGEPMSGDGRSTRTVAAPLERMPMWQRADRIVPMFARAADTLAPATAPGVTSYADPAYGRELLLRIVADGTAEVVLHDGGVGRMTAFGDLGVPAHFVYTPGTDYDIVTFDYHHPGGAGDPMITLGATPLPSVADASALAACGAPGCYLAEPGRLRARVHTGGAAVDVTVGSR
jgi:alpha-D-xyloside xylohydrolase